MRRRVCAGDLCVQYMNISMVLQNAYNDRTGNNAFAKQKVDSA
jgi:hypothetical protein